MNKPADAPDASAADLMIPGHASLPAGSKDSGPVHWQGQQAVVTLPDHLDVSNASQVGEELLSAINRGATVLIADMTATLVCDHAGADSLAAACRRAAVVGTQLRLVVTAQAVQRVLTLNGLDRVIPVYPSLTTAIVAGTPPTADAVTPEPGAAHPAQRSQPGRAATPTADMTTVFGRPGLDWTVVLRRQPARIVAGQAEGGYTNMFEIICCDCGDDPGLDYREVSPRLQQTRGPYPIAAGVAAYERHLKRHPNRQAMHQIDSPAREHARGRSAHPPVRTRRGDRGAACAGRDLAEKELGHGKGR